MKRNEEFTELKQELEETPSSLEYIAAKAISRAKKQKKLSLLIKTPAISFCSIILIFILLVNLFPKVALAMRDVPILKNLVQAVAFDPSLKEAVKNDYYQPVGDSQTKEDVTVTTDYMIVDPGQISLFFSVDAPIKKGSYHFEMQDKEGNSLRAGIVFDTMYEVGKLEEIVINFTDEGYTAPDEFTFKVTINQDPDFKEVRIAQLPAEGTSDSSDSADTVNSIRKDYTFSFTLQPEKKYLQSVESIMLNQWLDIKGQRIYLDRLDIYPSSTRLYLDCDYNNSSVIEDLGIYFKDESGKIYNQRGNGIVSTGSADSFDISSINFESSYFTDARKLTMYITDINIVEKDKQYGEIDFSNRTITNLPKNVTISSMELKYHSLSFTLQAKMAKKDYYSEIISSTYYDKDNNEYNLGSWSTNTDENKQSYNSSYTITDFEDGKYNVRWIYAEALELEEPIEINIK